MEPATTSGHRSAVVAAMLAAGALIAQQVAGRATRDALFLSTFHVSSLPLVMIAGAGARPAEGHALGARLRPAGEHQRERGAPRARTRAKHGVV